MIELRASRAAGGVLGFVVMGWCLAVSLGGTLSAAMAAGGAAASTAELSLPLIPALAAVQALFAGFVLSNLVYFAAVIAGHRR